ncbi:969_t:CDS:1, partial [Cetraspora pellucida]
CKNKNIEHYYRKKPDEKILETVLKNHFMNKHQEIWKEIRYSTKIGSGKGKTRQKIVPYNETEETSTPSTTVIESNDETLEHLQLEEFQDNNEENQISTQENTIGIYSTDNSNMISNIKSIELDYGRNSGIEISSDRIKINGKCKIVF